ncbi:MAG: TetR/AcrR family transcriptional regulator [Acidimicrobiales bacterium]
MTSTSSTPGTSATSEAAAGALRPTETATRQRMIDAAVECILEKGFYRASTNEIARTAGVSWGVIQHHFRTREGLMLAVLRDGAEKFFEHMESARVEGSTVEARIEHLTAILTAHYGDPTFLAYLQVELNLDHDPATSAEVRTTMRQVAERSHGHVRRLLREALGEAASVPELATTVFLALRGFAISQQLQGAMAYDMAPRAVRLVRQRALLAHLLAPYVEQVAGGR